MANYNDGRIRNSRIGIQSYTNNEVTLDVIGFTNIDGKVGIGTTPNVNSEKLHVAGSIRIDNEIYDSANRSGVAGGFLSKDANGIKWIDINPIAIQGVQAYNNLQIIGAGQSFFGINFISGINTSGLSTDVIEGYVNDTNPNLLDIVVSDYWGVGVNSSIYRFSDVGIGTDSPIASLDVRGSVNIGTSIGSTSLSISGATGDVFIENLEVNSLVFGADVELNPDRLTVNEYLSVGLGSTALLTADTLLNKVGIGSTLPEQKLDVAGSVKIDGAIYDSNNSRGGVNEVLFSTGSGIGITWKSLTGGEVAGAIEISQSSPATAYYIVGSGDTTGIRSDFYSNSDIIFTGDGRLGIGTTQPTEEIEVIGDLKVSGITTTQNLYVVGVSTFQNDVHLLDNDNLYFGDGNDLRIYHGGGNSYIRDVGTGDLYIDGTSVFIRSNGSEPAISANVNGSVELYYDNNKKFETSGIGVTVFGTLETQQLNVSGVSTFQGNVYLGDSDILNFGDSNDLQIVHNGSYSLIGDFGLGNLILAGNTSIDLMNPGATEYYARFNNNGSVELYYDTNKKLETSGIGVTVFGTLETQQLNVSGVSTFQGNVNLGDNDRLRLGDGTDLQIYHDGFNSFIRDIGNGNLFLAGGNQVKITSSDTLETKANFITDGAVELYYDNDKKFETTGAGATVFGTLETQQLNVSGVSTFQGNVYLGDGDVLNIGDGNDLQIYHDGTNSIIDNTTGNLIIRNTAPGNVDSSIFIRARSDENSIIVNDDGSVELYYDNSKKFETTGIGVSIFNGASTTATIAGPAELVLDPAAVGDNTGLVRIKGDLYVDGTQTIINSTTIELADFIVGIATTATTDLLADGAGIQIGPDNTFLYNYNGGINPSLQSSENLSVATGKVYQIGTTERLSADTLSLGTGTTIHSPSFNVLTLGTSGVENVRISSGNVGINSTAPTEKLDVNGTTKTTQLIVSGVSTFQGNVYLNDLDILNFGADNDLQIFHDGFNSIIRDVGTGNLDIRGANAINLQNNTGVETYASFNNNGSVELYYDNLKKFETTGYGATVFGVLNAQGLDITGVSTLTTTLIGGGTSTGTANQPLQVNGGVYVSGNVGINSTTPTEKLDVNGTTKTTQLIVSGITTFQNDVNIGVGGTTAFFDVSTGRIGIGTIIDIVPYDNLNGGTLSVEASAGQLFSITNNLTSGSIFSVNDVSGIPSIDVDADGTIQLAPYGTTEYVGIGTTNPTAKLDVNGTVKATEFIGIGSQISNITFRQLSDVDGSNLVPVGAGTTTPDYLVIYDPNTDSFRFVDPKTYFGINNDFDPNPAIVDYGTY